MQKDRLSAEERKRKGLVMKKRKFDSIEDERAPNLSCNFPTKTHKNPYDNL